MRDVVALYKPQNRDTLPSRVVVHKTSRFWDDEIAGITEGLRGVARQTEALVARHALSYDPAEHGLVRVDSYENYPLHNLSA